MEPELSGLDIFFRLFAVLLLVGANGFFVASEFALVTVRRTRIDEFVRERKPGARAVREALDDLDSYIAAAQLGITMASLALGWIGEPALAALLEPLFGWLPGVWAAISAHTAAVVIAFALITALHIVLGEQVPKTMAIQRSVSASILVALPTRWFLMVFKPFIYLLSGASLMIVRLFGFASTTAGHHVPHTEEELKMIVSASTKAGVLEPAEEDMIHRVFEFADLTANQIMVPRTEVVGLPLTTPRGEAARLLEQHGFTRYPVYDGSLDNIVGIVNVKDLLPLLHGEDGPLDLRHVLRTPAVLPESIRVFRLLAAMQAQRRHIVVLIDEFGGTAGIVTLRDLLERIVGDVRSDKETDWPDIEDVGEREALLDGLLLIPDVNEWFGLELDEEEYHTIGGYVFGALGRRPEIADVIEAPGCRLTVEALDGMRVSRLRIALEEPATRGAADEI
ncbi:MAG: HlyC/CorC family transporter [Gemmatimonadetes bacterium]|nr:HlyC/CorC family transporter [Gemmatimonadota bacterium]